MGRDDSRHEKQARALLAELTIEEKLAQISCYFPTDIADTDDFGRRYPHGVGQVSCLEARKADGLEDVAAFQRRVQTTAMAASGHQIPAIFHMEGLCGAYLPRATSFPSGIGRASAWNPDLERAVGDIVGRQERALGISHTFAPVLDISRDSRMGRQGETYGEDPTLASALGVAFVEGLQSGADGLRTEAVAKHFLGFHHSEGGIHGAHCDIPDRLLIEVYGKPFQAAITLAGLRGVMPCYGSLDGEPVSGSRRFLTELLRDQMGFDGVAVSDYGAIGNLHTVQRVAESYAHAGLLALTAGLDAELHMPLAFTDDLAQWFADGRADIAVLDQAVLRVLTAKFRMGLFDHPFALAGAELGKTFHDAGDSAISLRSARESIILLRNDGSLPLGRVKRVAVIGCHAATARFFFGGYTHFSMAEGMLAANASMAGLAGGAQREIEHTVPGTAIQADDGPEFEDLLRRQQPGIRNLLEELTARLPDTEVVWARGYPIAGDDTSGYTDALTVAEDADVVLLTLGGKHGTSSIASMGEGIDATDINLPPCQDSLITKLAELGKPLIGIHLDGRPISSDTADRHLNAILEAWSPAEYGAEAIVDALLGELNPSGRLPVSVARSAGQIAVYYNHPHGSAWHQGESIGFPDYVDAPHTPRYHFGHGLSYTTFGYANLRVSAHDVDPADEVLVSADITNTGERAGTEIVQLYVSDGYASLSRPVLELAGFCRVDLDAGQSATVEFALPVSVLAFLDTEMRWLVEGGDVELLLGASSADIRLRDRLCISRSTHIDGRHRGFFATARTVREDDR
jgi:beta-glucosidase